MRRKRKRKTRRRDKPFVLSRFYCWSYFCCCHRCCCYYYYRGFPRRIFSDPGFCFFEIEPAKFLECNRLDEPPNFHNQDHEIWKENEALFVRYGEVVFARRISVRARMYFVKWVYPKY